MAEKVGGHPGSAWMDAHWEELERDHPNQWVACDATGVVAHHAICTEVLQCVQEKGKHFADVMIAFIPVEVVQ